MSETADRKDSLERFTITFRALPSAVPVAVRVRKFLKVALRAFGLINEGITDPPPEGRGARAGSETETAGGADDTRRP